jgi:hypothetical protein
MKCQKVGTRSLRVYDLPDTAEDGAPIAATDIEIEIRYSDSGPYTKVVKAIALDHVIIPAIVKALGGDSE